MDQDPNDHGHAAYRRPGESSYARVGWWAGHGAELVGAIAGFVVGFLVLMAVGAVAPRAEVGWIPWLTMVVGALGLRWLVRRQFTSGRRGTPGR